ncbi:MAG: hypothetical protein COX51_03250 [Syntrophobacteraceae bacterium CG23_combo_of_CG06-09_8_20_14_all_50_8]|nr:MAG: hypothetical protein COX51_03250 [Syntrophobacteraceae bacterium CG23_combo_of_CG06-09_8_20_14_all_50_8]
MKKLAKYFFQGILILLPIVLTIYIVVAVFRLIDSILGRYFIAMGVNIPGLGLLTTVVLIIIVGLLGKWFVSRRMLDYIDHLLGNMPLVKIIYNIIKDTTNALVGKRSSFAKVVMIRLPGDDDVKILGFITTEELEFFGLNDHAAVYILQSMQWAGFTLLVPKSRLEYLNVSPDKALQFIVSAGITGKNNSNGKHG